VSPGQVRLRPGRFSINRYLLFTMITLAVLPIFAAAGYSLLYLLLGGGLGGAIVIFIVLKIFKK